MRYNYNVYTGIKKLKTKTALGLSTLVLAVAGTGGMAVLSFGSAHADSLATVNGCSFLVSSSTWTLQSDCSSSAEIDVPAGVTLDGGGYTISPTFSKTSNSNNAALGVLSDDVTVKNLTVNGASGTSLHGINVYVATGVVLNDVTLENNDHNGLVVNGSNVTVNNITTKNNSWGGIDVDQGGGVTAPAVLTVNGTSTQTEAFGVDIHVDNTSKDVSVIDTNSQYLVTSDGQGGAVYTLKSIPSTKDNCKNSGWQNLRDAGGGFKNQGACVSFVASNGKSQH